MLRQNICDSVYLLCLKMNWAINNSPYVLPPPLLLHKCSICTPGKPTFLCKFGCFRNSCKKPSSILLFLFMKYSVGGIINVKVFCLHHVGHLLWMNPLVSNQPYFFGQFYRRINANPLFPAVNSSSIWPRRSRWPHYIARIFLEYPNNSNYTWIIRTDILQQKYPSEYLKSIS